MYDDKKGADHSSACLLLVCCLVCTVTGCNCKTYSHAWNDASGNCFNFIDGASSFATVHSDAGLYVCRVVEKNSQ